MSRHLREASQHHLFLQMVCLLSLLVVTVMVTGETPTVMKNTGAHDHGPGDSVCFMVQDGRSAAPPETLLFFISNTPGFDEVSQKGQPELVPSTH